MTKVVKFLESVSPYSKGEIAGFADDVADNLIASKKAVEHKPGKKPDKTTQATNPAQSNDPDGQGSDEQGGSGAGDSAGHQNQPAA